MKQSDYQSHFDELLAMGKFVAMLENSFREDDNLGFSDIMYFSFSIDLGFDRSLDTSCPRGSVLEYLEASFIDRINKVVPMYFGVTAIQIPARFAEAEPPATNNIPVALGKRLRTLLCVAARSFYPIAYATKGLLKLE